MGDWTASYIAMRALGDPDVFLPGDVAIRHALERLGVDAEPERWRPILRRDAAVAYRSD